MDKKNKKHILRWLAASMCAFTVTSLTGCAEEVSNLFGGNRGEVEVTASFNEPGKAVTRAHDGLNGSGFTLTTEDNSESKVRVMVDQNDGTYSEYDYDVTGATTINRDSKPTFPSGVSSVNVYGWYPAKSLANFTVAADQTGNNGYCLSDLMFANGTTCERNLSTGAVTSPANLSFSHVMAKVKVNLTLATGVTVKSATFKTMKTKVTVTATKPANAVTGYNANTDNGTTGDIALFSGSLDKDSPADDLKLCGVFPDQEKSGDFLVITASYNSGSDQTITYSFDAAKHFEKGNEYTMNISLDGTNVTTGNVDITAWNVESGTVNIGGGGGGGSLELQTSASGSNGYVTFSEITTRTWTGNEVKPEPTVTVKINGTNVTLVKDTDFEFSYDNNVNEGTTAQVIVTGKGMFSGSVSKTFSIAKEIGQALSTAVVGKIIGADGLVYSTVEAANVTSTAVAVVAFIGTTTLNAETGTVSTKSEHKNITPSKGVAIALCNAKSQNWDNADVIEADGNFTDEIISAVSDLKTAGKIQSDWMNLEHTSWVAIGLTPNGQSLNSPITSGMTNPSDYTNMSDNYWSTSECNNTIHHGWRVSNSGWDGRQYSVNMKTYSHGIRPVFAF